MEDLVARHQTIMILTLRKQAEDCRLAAIEEENDIEYAKTYFEQDYRKNENIKRVEDIIFDYFGIIEMQWEASKA